MEDQDRARDDAAKGSCDAGGVCTPDTFMQQKARRLTKRQRADAAMADYHAWVAGGCKTMVPR